MTTTPAGSHTPAAPADIRERSAGAIAYFRVLFRVLSICIFPVFCRFQKGCVIMGADELQCLLVFGIFVAGMVEKSMGSLAGLVLRAVYAGDAAFSQAAFLHPAFGPAQIPRAVQIPLFATLAGLLKFTTGLTVTSN